LLVDAGVRHASLELGDIARFWHSPVEDGWKDVAIWNLSSLWANYRKAGADRLLLGLLLEQRSDLKRIYEAIPGAEITVIQLFAPLPLIEQRLRLREKTIPEQEISGARWWVARLEASDIADHVVDNGNRPPRETAKEVLITLGWLQDR
jgi:hypothetical protein